jgi:lysophospholipase L1-like esterase
MKILFGIALVFISFLTMAQTESIKPKRYLALGDSYTIGESVSEQERWPVQLAAALKKKGIPIEDPQMIATTGWRTDDLKKAIEERKPQGPFDLVSLLIGVNNQYQGKSVKAYQPEFEELLQMAIQFAGNDKSKVFVVSIPDYGFTPFGAEKKSIISREIDEFNRVNESCAKKYGVTYINITDISRRGLSDPDLVATDGLHPSGKMYQEWVQKILGMLNF